MCKWSIFIKIMTNVTEILQVYTIHGLKEGKIGFGRLGKRLAAGPAFHFPDEG